MVAGRFERIFITVLTALCGLTIGYTLPLYLELDWRWRLLALPATVLLGWFTWERYSRGHQTEVPLENVSLLERCIVSVGMAGVGFAAPFVLSLVLNGTLPNWTIAVPLGFVLAVAAGLIAWHHPGLFFVNRGF